MGTMRGFATKIRVTAKNVPQRADQLVRQILLAVTTVVTRETPVDTGRAKANWQAQLGGPAAGQVGEYPAGTGGSTAAQAEALALARAQQVAQAYRGGVPVHLTNNLPYIGRLNEGSSDQAPAGFVQAAAIAAARRVARAKVTK